MKIELPDDWSDEQTKLYCKVQRFMAVNAQAMAHPKAPPMDPLHWGTICHNAGFVAAELSQTDELRIVDVETDKVIAQSPPGEKGFH